jgi:hypothetical protein
MKGLKNTKENKNLIQCLKKVNETDWVGNIQFQTLDEAVRILNTRSSNSGWSNPLPFKVKGLTGMFISTDRGSLFYDSRIIKTESGYLVEEMTMQAFNEFEQRYIEILRVN